MSTIKADDILMKVDRAKIHAMFTLPMVEGDVSKMSVTLTTKVPTAATDGNEMWVNPHFMNSIDEFQAEFVVLHEWAHCFLKHFSRGTKLPNKELFQLASDAEVNHLLRNAGVQLLPDVHCTPGYEDMTMEQIYRELESRAAQVPQPVIQESQDQGEGEEDGKDTSNEDVDDADAGGSGGSSFEPGSEIEEDGSYELPDTKEWGQVEDPGVLTDEESDQIEFEDMMRQETTIATASLNGKLPSNIESHVRSLAAKSKVDWKSEMADFVEQSMNGHDGYLSWTKPNKRFAGLGIHMPSIIPESEEIAILLDSSGSMDDRMYELALTEVKSIIDLAQPTMAHVVVFDSGIVSVDSYEEGVQFPDSKGRQSWGGTNPQKGFDYISENFIVNGIIVLSDMEFFTSPEDPEIPVLWVEIPTGDGRWWPTQRSFGRSIKVEA